MFKVGDTVVYPAHGVSEVEAIETREISGNKISFFILKVLDTQMTVMVPVTNVKNVGIRELIDKKGIEKVLDILKERSVTVDNQTWNRRYREYMEKIKSGSAFEIAEVLRDLNILKRGKELSFGERKMYDTAKNLLVNEIAISKSLDKADAEKMLLEAMGKLEPQTTT
ncbi:MAG: CarD family transcriptional regulator [Desulfomonilia bacterium]|jgi:CarD family transcriptional regulator|uniref:RNA polymerase-binding transcription factor CarD n=1 Tax=anaerobic digester metagenome TaxID=1263854 RepID=A0A485M5R3_9ZZZZ|nr:CarD family transcriptional regulator [Pseudomonadota bacterium]HON38215.1 CarD family transcriptional regulator [Deltaproteobacteria bacterium]HRS56065.1 CarD family transcriptional regulator [Desulfomonilia bacterium]HPD21553.1 CarD family transcriptional regulator [Deltaproteobacteria bacterium]HPX19777.1 CarD family transcriptional regulator [Deltaproteobacteria bacterium]